MLIVRIKPGKILGTFMRGFYIGAKLHWFIDQEAWLDSKEFQDMVRTFHAAFRHGWCWSQFANIFSELFKGETVQHNRFSSCQVGKEWVLECNTYEQVFTYINSLSGPSFVSCYDGLQDSIPFLPDTAWFISRISHLGITFATC